MLKYTIVGIQKFAKLCKPLAWSQNSESVITNQIASM